jgi:hypothetical protein
MLTIDQPRNGWAMQGVQVVCWDAWAAVLQVVNGYLAGRHCTTGNAYDAERSR